MQYLSFDLFVGQRTPGGYPLRAECASVGQAPTVGRPEPLSAFDPNTPDLQATLAAVRAGTADAAALRALGERLAAALLPGEIGQLFDNARSVAAAQDDHGLRLRLRLLAPELNALPWELLWRPDDHEPLAISTDTIITRYLNLRLRVPRLEPLRPLRLLALAPRAAGVDMGQDRAALDEAVAVANRRGPAGAPPLVEFTWLTDIVTEDAIRTAIAEVQPHIVHFIGHGLFEDSQPSLVLTDDQGQPLPAPGGLVAGFFRNQDSVRLVVLNACQGAAADSAQALVGLAPRLAAQGVPAVIAMQWDIFNWAAQAFAGRFYRGLLSGPEAGEVETAVTRARAVLFDQAPELAVFATPALFLRVEGDRLWAPAAAAPEPAATPAPPPTTSGAGSISIGSGAQIGGSVVTGGMHVTGPVFEGPVHIEGDFVGGHKTVAQTAGGDIVGGNVITTTYGAASQPGQSLTEAFRQLQQQAAARPPSAEVDSDELTHLLQRLEAEAVKGTAATPQRLGRLLDQLAAAAGDLFTATAIALASPSLGLPEPLRRLATDKLQAHARRA